MRGRIYAIFGCLSVGLSHRSAAEAAAGGFAAERGHLQQISIDIKTSWYACSAMLRADGRGSMQACFS